MADFAALRPIERRVIRLAESGVVPDEIGRRFNRSGAFIERVLVLADLPGRSPVAAREPLRPLERRLLKWRARGASYEELADRFVRGPGHIERVIQLAAFKQRRADAAP